MDPRQTRERIFHPTYVRLLCSYIRSQGVSPALVLDGAGITWPQLLREERLVPFETVRHIVLAAKRLLRQPSLGLEFGISVEIAAHGLAGAAIAAGHDVSDALAAAIRYRPLRGRAVEFKLVPAADYSAVIVNERFDFGDIRSCILEALVGALERALTAVAGAPLRDLDYRFPYAPPPWAKEYARLLSGTAHFNARQMELRVPSRILRMPSMLAESETRAAIIAAAEHELASKHHGVNLPAKIRTRLVAQQETYPTLVEMAQQLNMSPRTLLRKLRGDGVTYQMLLDAARAEVAEWYLLSTQEPIEAIAERLGYADASNFSRTFRRWFGEPPGKFRKDRARSAPTTERLTEGR